MTPEDTARVVAKIQLGDNRVIDALTLREWHDSIGHLDFTESVAAVTMHRQESLEYLMPAHVIRNVIRVRQSRPQEPLPWVNDPAPSPDNMAAMAEAYRSKDSTRIAVELGVYNRQLVDAGRRPIPEWPLAEERSK